MMYRRCIGSYSWWTRYIFVVQLCCHLWNFMLRDIDRGTLDPQNTLEYLFGCNPFYICSAWAVWIVRVSPMKRIDSCLSKWLNMGTLVPTPIREAENHISRERKGWIRLRANAPPLHHVQRQGELLNPHRLVCTIKWTAGTQFQNTWIRCASCDLEIWNFNITWRVTQSENIQLTQSVILEE